MKTFHSEMLKAYGATVDLSADELRIFLASCEYRTGQEWYGEAIEVKYNDQWLFLCRTDLKDDVRVGKPGWTIEQWRECAADHTYGARISKSSLAVIVGLSDG